MRLLSAALLSASIVLAQTAPAPQKTAPAPQKTAPKTAAPAAPKKAAAAPSPTAGREPGLYAIINTTMGQIIAVLYEKDAPVTVQNFSALARGTKPWKDPKTGAMVAKPLYNGVTFHRVIPNFMIQTGDPTGTGAHDCGFTIKDEVVPTLKFDRPGRLGMANTGQPHSGACQFFITDKPYPSLDPPSGTYTIFGQVVDGMEVADKIDHVQTANDKPLTPIKITSLLIKREGPPPAPATPAKKSAPASKTGTPAKTATPPPPAKK
jgi:peptidyl-prolyl cis-trans isomerase A (cyclophilin A)